MVVMEQQRRPRRSFPDEYKAEVIELCRTGDKSVGAIARDLDLSETAVRRWIAQAQVDAGEREGLTSSEREELSRLRRENRVLREERDILSAMTPQEWDAEWTRLAEEERDWKFANHAAIELAKIYARLDDDRKPAIDALLGRWVLGDPPGREFEAESLIRQFGILEALPAVRSARDACGTADAQSRGRREMLGVIIRELESLDPR